MNWKITIILTIISLIIISGCTNEIIDSQSKPTNKNEQEVRNLIDSFKTAYNNNDVPALKNTLVKHKINDIFTNSNFASKQEISESTLLDFKKEIGYKSINSIDFIDIDIKQQNTEDYAYVEVIINNEDTLRRKTILNIFKKPEGWKISWITKPQVLDDLPINDRIEIAQRTQDTLDKEFQGAEKIDALNQNQPSEKINYKTSTDGISLDTPEDTITYFEVAYNNQDITLILSSLHPTMQQHITSFETIKKIIKDDKISIEILGKEDVPKEYAGGNEFTLVNTKINDDIVNTEFTLTHEDNKWFITKVVKVSK